MLVFKCAVFMLGALCEKNGFSLAEMLIVMLILTVVLAACMPIVTKRAANKASTVAMVIPPGMIMWYPRTTPPEGFLECNGQSTSGYPKLAAVVGANVPDLRGEFIRGYDNNRGVDSGRVIKSYQKGSLLVGDVNDDSTVSLANIQTDRENMGWDITQFTEYPNVKICISSRIAIDWLTTWPLSGVARPRNIALLTCIKY